MKESKTQIIKRSQVNLNPCNPKRHTEEAINIQKRNFQKVGYMGGIVWNSESGNLIDGHRRIFAMDLMNGYDGKNDYEVKVEVVSLDEKTEKEQLTYMAIGNTKADIDLIADYAQEIDLTQMGLNDQELKDILSLTDKEQDNISETLDATIQYKSPEEKKSHVKEVKEQIKQKAEIRQQDDESYIMISFSDFKAKQAFCELLGIDENEKFAKGEEVLNMIK